MSKSKACWPAIPAALIDIKAKVSVADTTTDYLDSKIVVAGGGIAKAILNPGANEQLQLTVAPSADINAKVSVNDTTTNYLDSKIVVGGGGIAKAILNPGANEQLQLTVAPSADINAKVSVNDTTTNYLDSKIVAGTGITKTVLNPGANETLEIKLTTAAKTKVQYKHVITPAEFQLNGGAAVGTAVTPVNSNRYFYANMPEGTDAELDFPIHPKYDGTGIDCKIHWFVDDASHGTAHTVKYTARFLRNNDSMDTVDTLRAMAAFTDAASWVKYIYAISPMTIEGSYAAAGTNLHFMLMHDIGCAASGDFRILCVEFIYYITLD